ncbi:MAG: glutathione S-transferase family protein [Gammaproteobacteria bacterium]|nr:glutathione S-transferase family protein [Gammaproteobacteria bacterium]
MKLKLVSFETCPFVQRSVITLLEKNVEYDVTYLSIDEMCKPPPWFTKISPFHKVPVLLVGATALFESAVINEYLDEINPPSMHPSDPLQKAFNRAWIKFGEELLFNYFYFSIAEDKNTFSELRKNLDEKLNQLELIISDGPFFNGEIFSLIDAAFAPAFMRFDILEQRHPVEFYKNRPKISRWAEAFRSKDAVINSVTPDFENKLLDYIRGTKGYAATVFC